MKTFHKVFFISAASLFMLSGCANTSPYSDQNYSNQGANSAPRYANGYGVVDSINVMQTDNNGSPIGIGTVIGGVVGGVLGNQVGGGTGRTVATAAGAVGGAVVGHEIEKKRNNNAQAYRIGVRLNNGAYETYTQDSIGDMRVGDRVRINDGHVVRN
jgi:outer membrane lipoprotein SlyB